MLQNEDTNIETPKKKSKYDKFWRTPKLAEPKYRREKYDYPIYQYQSVVNPTTQTVECSMRNDHVARPKIRLLKNNKRDYSFLGPFFIKVMDKRIEETWNTIYYYYQRQMKEKKKIKVPKKPKKGQLFLKDFRKDMKPNEKLALFTQWSEKNALPKKTFPPEEINRGEIVNLEEIKAHLAEMATPAPLSPDYLFPREIPIPISHNALHGKVPMKIYTLAIPKTSKELPMKPLGISKGALHYIITDRVKALSVPKTTREKRELDIKENPFSISPAALKYKATERIIQLAKPLERD